jgi:hypothetical protein
MSKKLVICSIAIVLGIVAVTFGFLGYPPAGNNDGSWFVAPAINYALTGKFTNPIEIMSSKIADPSGEHRFLYYPPLFPLVLHFFIFPGLDGTVPLPAQAFAFIGFINAIVIAISAWILFKIATLKNRKLDWLATVVISAATFMIFRASWSFGGRTETLVRLLFTVGFALYFTLSRRPQLLTALSGILLGLAAATHVTAPFFLAGLAGAAYAFKHNFSEAARRFAALVGVAFLSFIAAMQISPFHIYETVIGTLQHGKTMVSLVNPLSAAITEIKNPNFLVFSIIAAAFVAYAIFLFLCSFDIRNVGSLSLLVFFLLVIAAYVFFAFFNARNYYLTPFLLAVFAVIVYLIPQLPRSNAVKYAGAFFAVALIIISLKHIILFPFFVKYGMGLQEARDMFRETMAGDRDTPVLLYGTHVWTLSEAYDQMYEVSPAQFYTGRFILLQEESQHPDAPQTENGCVLRQSFYANHVPKILGITLSQTVPGYNFALYDCPPGLDYF